MIVSMASGKNEEGTKALYDCLLASWKVIFYV